MGRRTLSLVTAIALSSGMAGAQRDQTRDRAIPHYKVGLEEMRSEQWEKAAAAFQRAVDIDPTFEMAYYTLGRTNLSWKRYVEAAAALSRCRDLYQAETGRHFANQQDAQRYRRDRLLEIDELIRQYGSGPQTGQSQQVVRQLTDQRQQIQEAIQRGTSMSLDSKVPAYVSIALGSAYFRLGQLADAEREYKAAIAADAKTGEAYSNLAVVYLQTGRFGEAEKAVKSAEKAGFKVNPMLKDEIAAKKK